MMTGKLRDLHQALWHRLVNGGTQKGDPFHNFVLGSMRNDGNCALRTVVLRKASIESRSFTCFTDIRSPKVAEIWSNKQRLSALFYDPENKIQVRILAKAEVHYSSEWTRAAFANLNIASRKNYATIAPPGSAINTRSNGLSNPFKREEIVVQDTEQFVKHFAVLECKAFEVDYLNLNGEQGQERARFNYNEHGEIEGTWLVP